MFFSLKRTFFSLLLSAGMVICCTACSLNGGAPKSSGETGAAADANAGGTEEVSGNDGSVSGEEEAAVKEASAGDIEGDWVMVYYETITKYEDGDSSDYYTMCDDVYSDKSEMKIHKEGDSYIADYRYISAYSNEKIYGNRLIYEEKAAYEGCPNDKWHYSFSKPFEDDKDIVITMPDKDTLVQYQIYRTKDDPNGEYELQFTNEDIVTYLRKDSPRLSNLEDLRYFDTVTVSTTKELLGSIKNNTRVILNEGTYNLSEVFLDAKTEFVDYEMEQYQFEGVSNLCLEAAEGAKVHLCVDDPYTPVLTFTEGCSNITLRGLTIGHNAEPGTCSGSVVSANGCSGLSIEKCDLYGCGTYGVEANFCSDIKVTDTVIRECTYGLVSLLNVMDAHFTGCEMYNSSGYEMIDLTESYDISFENCNIHDNDSSEAVDGIFVRVDEYPNVSFHNCKFSNNKYQRFSTYSVELEQCNVNDNIP